MGQSDKDINALIRGAQAGLADCFDGLIDLYANRLYGYFYRSSGSATVAEDLVQDVFLRLIRAIKRYDHREQFEAFLFRIAGNLNRDRIRKSRRSKERSFEIEGVELPASTTADAHTPSLWPPSNRRNTLMPCRPRCPGCRRPSARSLY